ncbi:MAG: hypothetical protein HY689_09715 [Chloroflexi bacterium]|nr:hypothetical protein [Chloroflexota bacterium]
MQRTRAYRRSQRRRFIRRRLKIILNAWGYGFRLWGFSDMSPDRYPYYGRTGMLGKFNLCCSCGMCRIPKYDRLAFRREKRRLLSEVDM